MGTQGMNILQWGRWPKIASSSYISFTCPAFTGRWLVRWVFSAFINHYGYRPSSLLSFLGKSFLPLPCSKQEATSGSALYGLFSMNIISVMAFLINQPGSRMEQRTAGKTQLSFLFRGFGVRKVIAVFGDRGCRGMTRGSLFLAAASRPWKAGLHRLAISFGEKALEML